MIIPMGGQFGVTAAAAPFDPESDITWHSFMWAEGSGFVALGISDGGAVETWTNETGESSPTQGTASLRPTYRASYAGLNSQPAIESDGTDWLRSGTFSANPSYASGVSVVVIGVSDSTAAAATFATGRTGTDENRIGISATGPAWVADAGNLQTGGTADTSKHLFVAFYDGSTGNDWLQVDGSAVVSGVDAGSETLGGLSVFNRNNGAQILDGAIALVGVYEGDFTADSEYANFKTWCSSHYGITVA